MDNITTGLNVPLISVGKCKNETGRLNVSFANDTVPSSFAVLVRNVTSCYLLDRCDLCGVAPRRGVCLPDRPIPECICIPNLENPSRPYTGEFCMEETTLTATQSTPSRWTPIVVGVLAGLAGLFCAITCCLLGIAVWRRRRHPREV